MKKLCGGIPIFIHNTISKDTEKFYISYNPSPRDYGSNTTCLHVNSTSQFLILNGDHRKQFNNCSSFEESLKYFYDNVSKANKLSEHGRIFKIDSKGKASYIKGGY